MSTVAEVKLWGRTIGAVALEAGENIASFEYDRAFVQSGIEPSPLHMPLSNQVYRFATLPRPAFHGLPGMLADALPDKFGNALIDTWLARQGRNAASFNAIERLCYTGTRGMGALEFHPAEDRVSQSETLQITELVELASQILGKRDSLQTHLADGHESDGLKHILQVGTSAGGARAKAVIAWNPATHEVRSGQVKAPPGFEYWLLKFDGVSGNKDKELEDPKHYGVIEYAYHLMAVDAGIEMAPCRLLEENGRRHFMTQRFDRRKQGGKKHMQSLGALGHFDFNQAGAYSYEQALQIARQLQLNKNTQTELYRRMLFNIIARNQDDHVKNIAFLMDRRGHWSLAPAYDITYSYNPEGDWTGQHQMSANGKRDHFTLADFKAVAATIGLPRGHWKEIYQQVHRAVSRWPEFAAKANLPEPLAAEIKRHHRLEIHL